MRMMNPSVMVLDWISWFYNLRRLELCFVDSPRVSRIFGYFKGEEAVQKDTKVGTTHLGTPGGPGGPWWVVTTLVASCIASSPYKYPNIPETLGE